MKKQNCFNNGFDKQDISNKVCHLVTLGVWQFHFTHYHELPCPPPRSLVFADEFPRLNVAAGDDATAKGGAEVIHLKQVVLFELDNNIYQPMTIYSTGCWIGRTIFMKDRDYFHEI